MQPNLICILILIHSVLLSHASLTAQDSTATQSFEIAEKAYRNGDYGRACFVYETAINEGKHSTQLYNNLGIAYLKDNKLGKSILAFERALRLNPNNREAQQNLAYAKQQIQQPVKKAPGQGIPEWWQNSYLILSSTLWAVLFILLLSTGILSSLVARYQKKNKIYYSTLCCFLFSVPVFLLGQARTNYDLGSNEAIVIRKQLGLRTKAELQDKEAWTIYEGTKVQLQKQKDNWYKIRLLNGLEGWVPAQMISPIGKVSL